MSALPASPPQRRIKVLIVDDSAVIRGLVSRWLEAETDIELVGVAVNGRDGIERVTKLQPDIVILDIEMPVMDGVTALPEILKAAPGCRVVMASTLTQRGAEVTFKALSLGASDYLPKPEASQLAGAADYKRDLLTKVRALGARALKFGRAPLATTSASPSRFAPMIKVNSAATPVRAISINHRPEALFIGSSTGGPEALKVVITALAGKINVPVFITQHMPAMFTKILAEHLTKQTGAIVVEGADGMEARPGVFHIAPGDRHMTIARRINVIRIALNQNPPENFCRPAVDPLFRSAAEHYGDKALAVILTGMGQDGCAGARPLVAAGSPLIAQDEESSVVWGMPGAVTRAGLACSVKPLNQIAPAILNVLRGVAP